MKKLIVLVIALGTLLSGCIAYDVPYRDEPRHHDDRDHDRDRDHDSHQRGDYQHDRDGDRH